MTSNFGRVRGTKAWLLDVIGLNYISFLGCVSLFFQLHLI